MNLIVTNNIGEYIESCVSLHCGQGAMTKKKKKNQVIHVSWDIPYHSRSTKNGMKLNLLGEVLKTFSFHIFHGHDATSAKCVANTPNQQALT